METRQPLILTKKCPHCERLIESMYKGQLEWNYEQHVKYCKSNKSEVKK